MTAPATGGNGASPADRPRDGRRGSSPTRRWGTVHPPAAQPGRHRVRFSPNRRPNHPLSATLLLRPTIPHPDLSAVLSDDSGQAPHVQLARDTDGKPVDALHIDGQASLEQSHEVRRHIWDGLGSAEALPSTLGMLDPGVHNEPPALIELIALYHMLQVAASRPAAVHSHQTPLR